MKQNNEYTHSLQLTNNEAFFLRTFMGSLSVICYRNIINTKQLYNGVNKDMLLRLIESRNNEFGDNDIVYSIWNKMNKLSIQFPQPPKVLMYQYLYKDSEDDTSWKITEHISNTSKYPNKILKRIDDSECYLEE